MTSDARMLDPKLASADPREVARECSDDLRVSVRLGVRKPPEGEGNQQTFALVHNENVEELNATQAVHRRFDPNSPEALRLPERMRFAEGWIVASPTGGLWLSYMPADNSSPNGIIMPLNEQARTESILGTAGPANAPGYQGVTATDTESVIALACAQGSL